VAQAPSAVSAAISSALRMDRTVSVGKFPTLWKAC
jgi:hypothetical protein